MQILGSKQIPLGYFVPCETLVFIEYVNASWAGNEEKEVCEYMLVHDG